MTVRYATADGTAVAGEDYEAASGTLTFAPGETERTVRVRVLDDAVEDSGETFRLVLSAPAGATLADPEALGTILNSEPVSEPPNGDLPAGLPHGPSTPGRVVVDGGPVTGEIEYDPDYVSDRDWFAVELEGGKHYRIDLEGSNTLHGRISAIYRVQDGLLSAVRTTREVETGTGEITAGEDGDASVWLEGAGGRHLLHRRQRARGAPQPRRWRHSKQWSGQPRRLPPRGGGIARHGRGRSPRRSTRSSPPGVTCPPTIRRRARCRWAVRAR